MLLAEQYPESVEDGTNDFSDLLQIAEQAEDHTQVDRANHEQRVVRAEKYPVRADDEPAHRRRLCQPEQR